MLNRIYTFIAALALLGSVFSVLAWYRSSLIEQGYDKAVAEYTQAEAELVQKHNKDVEVLQGKNQELQNAHNQKSDEVSVYRSKLSAVSVQLREQQADHGRRVEAASCGSIRRYADAVYANFTEARGHVERLGLEAASCSAAAETLREALDLANGQSPNAAY